MPAVVDIYCCTAITKARERTNVLPTYQYIYIYIYYYVRRLIDVSDHVGGTRST